MKTVLNSFLAKLTGKPEEKLLVTDKDTISYVQTKMKEMENEALIQRMKFLELAIKHMTFEYKKDREENKLLRELVIVLSTNIEELLNAIDIQQTPSDNTEELSTEEMIDEYEEEELRRSWDRTSKKVRLN
jgi:hypothetical protein